MRIQYASDLHLEFNRSDIVLEPVAPVLVLAGDIGDPTSAQYRAFLADCARRWEHVVVVAGNHEFYNRKGRHLWRFGLYTPDTVAVRLAACRWAAMEAGANVHFLERESVVIDGVRFLGCTLWSDVSGAEEIVGRRMSDYAMIARAEGEPLEPADVLTWHQRDRAWLEAEIAGEGSAPIVVVTHHLPTYALIAEQFAGSPLNAGFASHLDNALVRPPVRAWICGHSHQAGRVDVNGVTCVLNPVGYPYPLEPYTGFREDAVVTVER